MQRRRGGAAPEQIGGSGAHRWQKSSPHSQTLPSILATAKGQRLVRRGLTGGLLDRVDGAVHDDKEGEAALLERRHVGPDVLCCTVMRVRGQRGGREARIHETRRQQPGRRERQELLPVPRHRTTQARVMPRMMACGQATGLQKIKSSKLCRVLPIGTGPGRGGNGMEPANWAYWPPHTQLKLPAK